MSLIKCKAGKFEGVFLDNCHNFFGIPYAKYDQRWGESTPLEQELFLQAW